jgi:hypothetical protein
MGLAIGHSDKSIVDHRGQGRDLDRGKLSYGPQMNKFDPFSL